VRLHSEVQEDALCVFFRNNHFSAMHKRDGKLYLLITDYGYARERGAVWEKLDAIDGT
jgi:ubiquitin carboxyl-terminal hydrolase MINDY-1/2